MCYHSLSPGPPPQVDIPRLAKKAVLKKALEEAGASGEAVCQAIACLHEVRAAQHMRPKSDQHILQRWLRIEICRHSMC